MLSALLFTFAAAGCVSPDAAGPFEFEEGEDWGDPVGADVKADGTTPSPAPVCSTRTTPLRAIGGEIITPTGPRSAM
jgi:hypothetical protein